MKSNYRLVSILLILLAIIACQKELDDSKDLNAKGQLAKDSAGNCSLIVATGNYVQGKALNDSNKLAVTVNVTKPGNYTIRTDTINGYFFQLTGNFSTAGQQSVLLTGRGNPGNSGTNPFTIFFDTSVCHTTVVIRPAVPPAAFTLTGAPNGCTSATLTGPFATGALLDTSSYIIVTINVTVAGAYSIRTDTVNGYSFSGTGIITTTGMQTVKLYASGMPLAASTNTFTVRNNNSACSFPVTAVQAVAVSNSDYFPLTTGSFWIYNDLKNPGDTMKRIIVDSTRTNGFLYKRMTEVRPFRTRQLLFRKELQNYLEYAQVEKYTSSITYNSVIEGDLNFLKENASFGSGWQSTEFTGTTNFGQVILIRYNYYCNAGNATVSVGGRSFTNVIKIQVYPEIKSLLAGWSWTFESYELYYAKGVGLIYLKVSNNGFAFNEWSLKTWQVN